MSYRTSVDAPPQIVSHIFEDNYPVPNEAF